MRLGASVTGIDATKDMIEAAKLHATLDPALNKRLRYLNVTSSDLVKVEAESFDGVVATEVIEHVSDVESFVTDCIHLAKVSKTLFFFPCVFEFINHLTGAAHLLECHLGDYPLCGLVSTLWIAVQVRIAVLWTS